MNTSEDNHFYLLREKSAHIVKAARSATLANVLAPLLCIPVFKDEVNNGYLILWLTYMAVAIVFRSYIVYGLNYDPEKISDPEKDLKEISIGIGFVGFGWGLGWMLMAPDLSMVNRMIYVYMITAAMISSMFAYSVNKTTFYSFTLPIIIPSLGTDVLSGGILPWTFTVGLASVYVVVISISRNFSKIFENSVSLRFKNEKLYLELANERDQSVSANIAKSKFIATASHDLRQPMHAINVYFEILDVNKFEAKEKSYITKIKNCMATLNTMFDALLDISKLDAHALKISSSEFDLKVLANTLRDLYSNKILDSHVKLEFYCEDACVVGDRIILQQIVGNLISNSIQYSNAGLVFVRFYIEDGLLNIDVEDEGCGISDFDLDKIFNEFFRSDRTRAKHDGLGLGLTIVKRLSDLIDAKISISSKENMGTKFNLKTQFKTVSVRTPLSTEDVSVLSSGRLMGKKIAIIEDNLTIADAYAQALTVKGAQVIVLSDDEKLLDLQLEHIDAIDCILIDYRLSETTGDVLIEKLRENFNSKIPAVMVTADTSPSHIQVFENMAVRILYKPISFQEIIENIEAIISE